MLRMTTAAYCLGVAATAGGCAEPDEPMSARCAEIAPMVYMNNECALRLSEDVDDAATIVVERQVLDTTALSDCLRYCRESRAHTDDSELAVPPEAIALVTEHLSDTLDSGPEIRFIEVLQPVHRQVIFARPELERGRRREPVPAYGSRGLQYRET